MQYHSPSTTCVSYFFSSFCLLIPSFYFCSSRSLRPFLANIVVIYTGATTTAPHLPSRDFALVVASLRSVHLHISRTAPTANLFHSFFLSSSSPSFPFLSPSERQKKFSSSPFPDVFLVYSFTPISTAPLWHYTMELAAASLPTFSYPST